MNTTSSGFEDQQRDRSEGDRSEGDRSEAVRLAEAGSVAWRAALAAQQGAAPDHVDFYGLARELVASLGPIVSLVRLVSGQVAGYAEGLPAGRGVYDDTRVVDPHERLADAAEVLGDISTKVGWAALEMNRFWSLVGHVGVEDVTS